MKQFLMCSAAMIAVAAPSAAFAQSTGSIDFENEIVVTGAKTEQGIAGVIVPDTSRAKAVLGAEFIQAQTPGQTINEIINQLPGVSFQNNDPFGSAGGTLTIRGFDDQRISQTFDGLPLNDTGGYALYSNQQLDPEIIEQVNVNLGSTDVDSPTAAATGSTVNYRSITPSEDFSAKMVASVGDFEFFRMFGLVQTGNFTKWGTRAFLSASRATNNAIYGGIGEIDKQQYNAKIYQPIGSNGDFISLAGHYNENRNNFFGSVPLRLDADRVVGGGSANRFPVGKDERFYQTARCIIADPRAGIADTASSCGSDFEYRYNPSNTGNIRVNSRFTLSDGLILTVDPSYQYTKANGGGTSIGSEGLTSASSGLAGATGFIQGSSSAAQYFFGRDINGDGDMLDTVRLHTPSQTQTHRYGLITSLRYDLDPNNTIRVAYSFDRGRHRQTGEAGYLTDNGFGARPFPVNNPIVDVNGAAVQKRNRLSYAILHQVSGEYRGKFMDMLTVTVGLRAPFFKRDLNNYCATATASGNLRCFENGSAAEAAYAAANPTVQGPQRRVFKYDKLLPSAGFVVNATDAFDVFGNYSKGLQVPGTDNLYQSFFYDPSNPNASPTPETTDNFDLGVRYRSPELQAQLSGWYTIYSDRLASAYDRDLDTTIYRNLGRVDKYGIDGSVTYQPIPEFMAYVFGSYLKSKIKDDVELSATTVAQTSGKRESGAPVYTFGGRIQGEVEGFRLGVQAKRTGPRYINDQNLPVFQTIGGVSTQVYGAKAPAYTLVDIDARYSLEKFGAPGVAVQLNVTNVFDKVYVGGFDGTLSNTSVTFAQIGAPRTFIGSVVVGF
ncbi:MULTISPECIES: TonB-dependent receptor [unclassified Sphingobium]|uniref:TonB-dependent receptor n=1 Tax=unclassified Sphingobium TaxID=2611147 RepID=UPI000D16DBD9|nr:MULTISPECIES: TonB-dependent receptor [unclassified Sphingobium]MBG6117244.1 iron complex outermembrane receptor protein [Sphingobium sp. JAI105]PSO11222.1 TonB-dependent receptor [Sphingobium sp. AEW4]TWD12550.1 iron complex outermembrane receptor protein [Sphingobium sp. AEW010]TWD30321.1 iron complex outermembrane receptor protein [Sphingobium sp. AEW013]TWD30924.1 iron complex outermembrane receptor protein [Sphingobium sp. AEW001]